MGGPSKRTCMYICMDIYMDGRSSSGGPPRTRFRSNLASLQTCFLYVCTHVCNYTCWCARPRTQCPRRKAAHPSPSSHPVLSHRSFYNPYIPFTARVHTSRGGKARQSSEQSPPACPHASRAGSTATTRLWLRTGIYLSMQMDIDTYACRLRDSLRS